jgi:hypothetical protein
VLAWAPHGTWPQQVARNVVDHVDGFLNGKRCLLHQQQELPGIGPGASSNAESEALLLAERFSRSRSGTGVVVLKVGMRFTPASG